MSKVFIGVGHGGKDPGAVGYIKEKDGVLVIATACKDYLEANGVEALMSRYIDEDEGLNEKINECNAFNPDLALDIHLNAGKGDGAEVFHSIVGGAGKELAQYILDELIALGQQSRGIKTKVNSSGSDYFGFIRSTKSPAVITEAYFVDNAEDVRIGDTVEEQKIIGQAIAKGVLKKLGIESRNDVPSTPAEPEKKQIEEDGKWGRETTIRAQEVFGTPVDGIVSNQYARYKNQNKGLLSSTFEWKDNPNQNGSVLIGAIQRWVGVKEDRLIGPDTIRGMQEKLGTPVDGFISDPSVVIKAFQKWLNAQ